MIAPLTEVLRVERGERGPLGIVTIASGLLAFLCIAVGAHAVRYDFEAFGDPTRLLAMEHLDLAALRAFLVLDMFGYYLLLTPIIVVSHRLLASRTPWSGTIVVAGIAYVLIGAIGAAILTATWPPLLEGHASADPQSATAIRASFTLVTHLVYGGLWNLLEVSLAGVWWVGFGVALRSSHPKLAWATILTGVFPLGDGVASMLGLGFLHEALLDLYLLASIAWPIAIGVVLLREKTR